MITITKNVTIRIDVENHEEVAIKNASFFKKVFLWSVIKLGGKGKIVKRVNAVIEEKVNKNFNAEKIERAIIENLVDHGVDARVSVRVINVL